MSSQILTSLEAEQSLIGALLVDQSALVDVQEILSPSEFFQASHHHAFAAMANLAEQGKDIDVITVCERISATGQDADLTYLSDLAFNVTGTGNVLSYARIIHDRAMKRKVAQAGADIQRWMHDHPEAKASEFIEHAQSLVIGLDDRKEVAAGSVAIADAAQNYINELKRRYEDGDVLRGLATGLVDIDRRLNGMKKGNLILVAARPSMGKTTYALQSGLDITANQKKRGLFFSLEMTEDELMQKAYACIGRIPLDLLEKPTDRFFQDFGNNLHAAVAKFKSSDFHIIDCPNIHINQLKSYARKSHRRAPVDFIMVDHIHLMDSDGQTREQQISKISSGLKGLAKELDCPVIALAQLNRSVEQRPNKRPILSDLRDGGTLEQDSDVVQFLYRDEYYDEDSPNKGIVELHTAKYRNGKVGRDYLANRFDQSRLENFTGPIETPQPKKSVRHLREAL